MTRLEAATACAALLEAWTTLEDGAPTAGARVSRSGVVACVHGHRVTPGGAFDLRYLSLTTEGPRP